MTDVNMNMHETIGDEQSFKSSTVNQFQTNEQPAEHFYALFLAGGSGSRLWPLSRSDTPKQLLPLLNDGESLLRTSVGRLEGLLPPDHIYIVTSAKYASQIRDKLPEVPPQNIISEPCRRDSGPATALGMGAIERHDPEAVVAILTADHHIPQVETFRRVLSAAREIAVQNDTIVTLGNLPDYPATGFGYIQRGEKIGEVDGFEYFEASGFKEKPDYETAQRFLDQGNYDWNSGMFIWTVRRAMYEFERQQPQINDGIEQLLDRGLWDDEDLESDQWIAEIWEDLPSISLDYAVMEDAEKMAVMPIDVGMVDIGTWGALFGISESDDHGNGFSTGQSPVVINSEESFVVSDNGKVIAVVGMHDVIIVDTHDALLVCHKEHVQEVKNVVNILKQTRREQYV